MADSTKCPYCGLFSFPYDHFAVIRWQATRQPGAKVEKIFNICRSYFALANCCIDVLDKKAPPKKCKERH